jgi:hypothetical protein
MIASLRTFSTVRVDVESSRRADGSAADGGRDTRPRALPGEAMRAAVREPDRGRRRVGPVPNGNRVPNRTFIVRARSKNRPKAQQFGVLRAGWGERGCAQSRNTWLSNLRMVRECTNCSLSEAGDTLSPGKRKLLAISS